MPPAADKRDNDEATEPNHLKLIDLKAHYRGFRYVHEILKMLPEIPDPILLNQIFAKLTALGRIHPVSTGVEPSSIG